jgi:flagellar basal-body rod protein FlgG
MRHALAGTLLCLALTGCTGGYSEANPYPACFATVPHRPLARASVKQTSQPLDLAVDGEGYFMVKDPAAEKFYYTRLGQFRIGPTGRLVTQDGRLEVELTAPSAPSGSLPATAPVFPSDVTRTVVSPQGLISIEPRSVSALQPIAQLKLASFPNREGLKQVGPGLFEQTCASGPPLITAPKASSAVGILKVGYLESEAAAGASDTVGSPRWHVTP